MNSVRRDDSLLASLFIAGFLLASVWWMINIVS